MSEVKRNKERAKKKVASGMRRWWKVVAITALVGCAALVFAVQAYNRREAEASSLKTIARNSPILQGATSRRKNNSRLSLQPEANRMRRRLGQRFVAEGRDQTVLVGTLTVNGQSQNIRIFRTQEDDDEKVEIALGQGLASLTWSSKDGAMSDGIPATGEERALIERLALDSPDQFILAQLRGASYYTVARDVRPEGADDDYAGPVWNVVRIGERQEGQGRPESLWRTYYINTQTGLIERIKAQRNDQLIVAELSEWGEHAGELAPARIRWSRDGEVLMELELNNVSNGPRQ